MRKSTFIKHLEMLSREELVRELSGLYDRLDEVSEHYAMELGSNAERKKKFEKVKKQIKSKYKTKSFRKPRRPRIQKINKIIADVRKKSIFEHEMIDIYLFNTEEALNFMNVYNFSSTPLFNIIEKSFTEALELIRLNKLIEEYNNRCTAIVRLSEADSGLHKLMKKEYERYYSRD